MIPKGPFSCDILHLHGCCCRRACPRVHEAGEGTRRRRRLPLGEVTEEAPLAVGLEGLVRVLQSIMERMEYKAEGRACAGGLEV